MSADVLKVRQKQIDRYYRRIPNVLDVEQILAKRNGRWAICDMEVGPVGETFITLVDKVAVTEKDLGGKFYIMPHEVIN